MRALLLIAIAILYGLSIPWYRASGETADRLFGLPDWVAVAVACYALIALLNALAWLVTEVADDEPDAADDE